MRRRGRIIEQLGNAEIQQLDLTVIVDENVRRLDVTMHDQIAMCVRHRFANLDKQFQVLLQRRIAPVFSDRAAGDKLHRHVGATLRIHAAVVEAGDAGMFESGENPPLRIEAPGMRRCIGVQQLDRRTLRVATIDALAAVHIAHAAAADTLADPPRPDPVAGL